MASIIELLCSNNRIVSIGNRIRQALSPRGVTSTTSDDKGTTELPVSTDDILERWDKVLLQLKRTHLHLFLISGFDGIELDAGLILPVKRHRLLPLAPEVDDDLADLLHVRDEKTSGTAGGGGTSGSYGTRTLNTVVTNEISGASLASNQITLPAGTYRIEASAPSVQTNRHKAKLRDTTGAADLIIGTSAFGSSQAANGSQTRSFVNGQFILSAQSDLEIQHEVQTTVGTSDLGVASSFGEVEVYTEVRIIRIV